MCNMLAVRFFELAGSATFTHSAVTGPRYQIGSGRVIHDSYIDIEWPDSRYVRLLLSCCQVFAMHYMTEGYQNAF